MSGGIGVVGGSGGITASCDALTVAAGSVGKVAGDTAGVGIRLHQTLMSAELDGATLFDPVGSARVGAELALALDGPLGLMATAAQLALLRQDMLSAASIYRTADALATDIEPFIDAAIKLPVTAMTFQTGIFDSAVGLLTGDGPADPLLGPLQKALANDPELIDIVVRAGGTSAFLASFRGSFVANQLLADGRPLVALQGNSQTNGAPRNLRDIVDALDQRTAGGDIDVKFLESGTGGQRRVIVDIPGTDDWSTSQGNSDVCNLGTNLLAIEGHPTTYQQGVIGAMRDAGVRSDDQVMLVGHSQGGMVAMTMARDLSRSGEFKVSHVITAGSPIAAVASQIPREVQVLAIENDSDIVPHLDGADNPDRANITTVTVHQAHATIGENHGLKSAYVAGAADIDAARHRERSIDDFLNSAGGFTSADVVRTQVFHISREPR